MMHSSNKDEDNKSDQSTLGDIANHSNANSSSQDHSLSASPATSCSTKNDL
jgi:hypothetical protein